MSVVSMTIPKVSSNNGTLALPAFAANNLVIDLLGDKEYIMHDLDLSELAKGMGGPNCLVMPIERRA